MYSSASAGALHEDMVLVESCQSVPSGLLRFL